MFKRFSLLSFVVIVAFLISNNVLIKANELDDEKLIITHVGIDDDFSDDAVIIVLKHDISLEFINYTIDDFNEIDCIKVEDLTECITKIVKDEIEANKTGNYSKLGERISKNMLVNIDTFHRILCLYLNNPGKKNVIDAIRLLEKREDIISAEPDYIERIESSPNDLYYVSGDQWGLDDITGTPPTYGINAMRAWNYSTGSSTLLIGVIDSGIDASHPDLVNNINDNLHRDYVDHPWYATYRNVSKSDLEDSNGHGTHVAGIIGAQGNNSVGIAGVMQQVKLVSLRVSDASGFSSSLDAKRAIDYATDKLIQVLNYSIGGTEDHNGRKNAIQNYPGLFVCAAGNDSQNNDLNDYFPSNYNFSNLIAVGAINSNGYKRPSSNYGQTTVDIFAPGGEITSTWPLDLYDSSNSTHVAIGYRTISGTSMATPFVTGVAALMLSINPNLTPQQIKATIMNNATKYSELEDLCVCEGRLDAYKAVSAVALDTETVGNNIKINGFISGYTPPSNMELTIPECFAKVSSTYGTPQRYVQSIDDDAFRNKSTIISVTLPNGITSIGESSFENCYNLSSIELPNLLISIGDNSFKNCSSLEEIALPSLLETIGNNAFKGCTSLGQINISNSVNSIGNEAFYGCTGLSSVIVNRNKAPLLTLGLNAFYNHPTNFEITVPKNRLADYNNMSGWYSYRSNIDPSENFIPTNLYYNTGMSLSPYIFSGLNKLYAINVISQGAYVITITSGTNAVVKIYNSGFILKDTITSSKSLILNGSTVYYVSLEHSDVNTGGTISVSIAKDLNHNHIYNHSYTWLNYNQHDANCACGATHTELHVVSAKSLGDGLEYVTCILCGGPANAGIVPGMKGIQITNNGSFISPNGILVLADEDIDGYLAGEIVFEHENVEVSRDINIPPYLLKKDEDYFI